MPAETGVTGVSLMLGMVVLVVGATVKRVRELGVSSYAISDLGEKWMRVGAGIACCGLMVHSLTDFNLPIPANAAWGSFAVGLVCCGARGVVNLSQHGQVYYSREMNRLTGKTGTERLDSCGPNGEAQMGCFYSQNGEDDILSRLFEKQLGVCVEVGAHNGVTFSNTYHFENLGWKCILVEANPVLCREIRLRRAANTKLFECAASSSNGRATMKVGAGSNDVYSSLECIQEQVDSGSFTEISVTTRTLDSMLEEAGVSSIDFISIDVEGHEMHVLGGLDLTRWTPRFVLLEDSNDFRDEGVCQHMAKAGYFRFYRSGGNDWFARHGERRIKLLTKLLSARQAGCKGVIKGNLPHSVIRPALSLHRSVVRSLSL